MLVTAVNYYRNRLRLVTVIDRSLLPLFMDYYVLYVNL